MERIIEVQNLWKKYSLLPEKTRKPLFGEFVRAIFTGETRQEFKRFNEFWALREISFDLNRGETLGIVGLNGAGKSTLLKLILGRATPDIGTIHVSGKMGGLIDLGAGFQPEYSGLRNIYLNAEIMGVPNDEIERMLPDIIEFSELGKFIDAPVKNYSSGMYIRLGFSIAIHFIPDLVICDEILAVGDFEFRQKCLNRMNELKKERTFILVSHSAGTINDFCDKAMMLHKGLMVVLGSKKKVLRSFALSTHNISYPELIKKIEDHTEEDGPGIQDVPKTSKEQDSEILVNKIVKISKENFEHTGPEYHNREYIESVSVYCDREFDDKRFVTWAGEPLRIIVKFRLLRDIPSLRIGLPFFDASGAMLIGPDSRDFPEPKEFNRAGDHTIEVHFKSFPFNKGTYFASLAINNDPALVYRKRLGEFTVLDDSTRYGIVRSSPVWRKKSINGIEFVEVI